MSLLGVPGVYTRRLNVTTGDVASNRRLCNYLKIYLRRYASFHNFSPLTLKILNSVPSLAFAPCFVLAWTLIRINEISQIDLPGLKSLSDILIKSSKSDHIKTVSPLHSYKIKTLNAVPNHTRILVISYDSLKNSIKSARSQHDIVIGNSALDCTHIFRHLEASWMFKCGVDPHTISSRLGHKMDATTRQYIHKDLYL